MIDIDELIRNQLAQALKKKGKSAAQVSTALRGAGGRNYLGRKIRGAQKLTTYDLAEVTNLLRISAGEFATGMVASVAPQELAATNLQAPVHLSPSHYAAILRHLSPAELSNNERATIDQAIPDYFYEPIPRHLDVSPSSKSARLLQQIDAHPNIAFELSSKEVLSSASKQPKGDPSLVLEHASLLNAWAVAARRIGKISFAADLTSKALELHGRANLSRTYPPLLRTMIAILDEVGEQEMAMAAAQHCALHSLFIEGGHGLAKSALALSRVHLRAGDTQLAIRALSKPNFASSEVHFRIKLNLGYVYFQEGRLDECRAILDSITPASKYEDLHKEHLHAKLLAQTASTTEALEAYDQLIEDSTDHLQPSHRLMLFLEVVPLLRRHGQTSAIRVFASRFYKDLERLEMNRTTRALRDDVLNAATRGVLREGLELEHQRTLVQDV